MEARQVSTYQVLILWPGPNRQGQISVVYICKACVSHPAFETRCRKGLRSNCTDSSNKVPPPDANGMVISELAHMGIEDHVGVCTFKPTPGVQRTTIHVSHLHAAGGFT
jgi:hypothetical protein